MLFKLKDKCAPHKDGKGKEYVAGDIVESDDDLAKQWPTKFELVLGSVPAVSIQSAPSIPAPAKKDDKGGVGTGTPTSPKSKKKGDEKENPHGKDVTADFPNASKAGFKIYEKGNWFTVCDANDGEKMNEKALRKKDVQIFLDKYANEDEDEDEDKDNEDDEDES